MNEFKLLEKRFPKIKFLPWENIKSHSFYNPSDKMTSYTTKGVVFGGEVGKVYGMSFVTEDGKFGYGRTGLLILTTKIKTGFFGKKNSILEYNFISFDFFEKQGRNNFLTDVPDKDFNFLKRLNGVHNEYKTILINEENKREDTRLKNLNESKSELINELDKDGNGQVDVVEGNDFNSLLKKHQKSIVEIDRNYVQQFFKISSYLKTKKENIQSIFNSIKDTPNKEVLNEYVEILKDEIHSYNLILLNSLNMIVSLVEDDMITFYEIHEKFDNLNMFSSKHEKDISQKLENIGDGLKTLMYEIRRVGEEISYSIQDLTYVTEELNNQLTNQLSEIDSTLKVGNLINTINTYQNYKNNRRLN